MKKVFVIAAAALLALCFTACGSSNSAQSASASSGSSSAGVSSESASAPSASASSSSASSSVAAKDFDGSKYSEAGDCSFWLRSKAGDNKDGSVMQLAVPKNMVSTQIDIACENGDGSVCTVYVDGIENRKVNVTEQETREIIDLAGTALDSGVHDVELVQMDGDTPTIYKKTQYEIVK